jgi:hypothetical protein
MPINDNYPWYPIASPGVGVGVAPVPNVVTVGATVTGVTAAATGVPWTLPQGCSCTYRWMVDGNQATQPERQPSFSCRVHSVPPEAANEHVCPTCGR